MFSEISVPLDGSANTQLEISAAIRLARIHQCPVVGWPICVGSTTPPTFSQDLDDTYSSGRPLSRYGHMPIGSDAIARIFLEEASTWNVAAKIAECEILEIPEFYHRSSASDLAVVAAETINYWRAESNAFLRGDFSSYKTAPLLIMGASASTQFEDVVFAYDGSRQALAALKAYASMEAGAAQPMRIVVCDDNPTRASIRSQEAQSILSDEGISVRDVTVRLDFLKAVIDDEFAGRSVLLVAGLCTQEHPHRPRFGHLADHLISTQAASMLLAS